MSTFFPLNSKLGLSTSIFPDIFASGILTSILEEALFPRIIPFIVSKFPFFSILIFASLVLGIFKSMFNFGSLIFGPLIFPLMSKLFFNFGAFKSVVKVPPFISLFIFISSLLEPFNSPSFVLKCNLEPFIFVSGKSIFIWLPYNLLEPLIFCSSI